MTSSEAEPAVSSATSSASELTTSSDPSVSEPKRTVEAGDAGRSGVMALGRVSTRGFL